MGTDLFSNKYRIDSARASWHDYSGGIYFITICTANKRCYFGHIVKGVMVLSPLGRCIKDNLEYANDHYPYIEIPLFVVMPNHIHAVILIADNDKYETGKSRKLLPIAIGGIKAAVTTYAHRNNMEFAWQSRYHDRIIRNQEEANRIGDYIENNPLRWNDDCFFVSL